MTYIAVHYVKKDGTFKVVDLETLQSSSIPNTAFLGIAFKYPCDFERRFLKEFRRDHVQYTDEARDMINQIMEFNRVDSWLGT